MRIAHNSKIKTQNSTFKSVSSKDIACIDLVFYILQAVIKAVGDDCFALRLEGFEVINYFAAEVT